MKSENDAIPSAHTGCVLQ